MKVGSKTATATRPTRGRRPGARRPQEGPVRRQGPQTAPLSRPVERPSRAKNADQAKARAKARKAKAPRVIRRPLRERLRERLIARMTGVDLRPQVLLARIPFVMLVIGALAIGLAITLWLSTDAAQRSYQLGSARALNDALTEQKESLERDVLEAQSAPALADAARNLGMIPSRDTAHLIRDPAGNWVVVGQPKPAAGAPPPPLNTKLPEEKPATAAKQPPPVAAMPKPGSGAEVPTRLIPLPPEVPARVPAVPVPPAGRPAAVGGLVLQPVPLDPGPVALDPAAPAVPVLPAAPPGPPASPVPAPPSATDPEELPAPAVVGAPQ